MWWERADTAGPADSIGWRDWTGTLISKRGSDRADSDFKINASFTYRRPPATANVRQSWPSLNPLWHTVFVIGQRWPTLFKINSAGCRFESRREDTAGEAEKSPAIAAEMQREPVAPTSSRADWSPKPGEHVAEPPQGRR